MKDMYEVKGRTVAQREDDEPLQHAQLEELKTRAIVNALTVVAQVLVFIAAALFSMLVLAIEASDSFTPKSNGDLYLMFSLAVAIGASYLVGREVKNKEHKK